MNTKFYKKWNNRRLDDGCTQMSSEYKGWQRALLIEMKKIAKELNAEIVNYTHGFHFESYMFHRNGKYVYVHREGMDRCLINLDDSSHANGFLVRTAAHKADWTGGQNNFTNYENLQDKIHLLFLI